MDDCNITKSLWFLWHKFLRRGHHSPIRGPWTRAIQSSPPKDPAPSKAWLLKDLLFHGWSHGHINYHRLHKCLVFTKFSQTVKINQGKKRTCTVLPLKRHQHGSSLLCGWLCFSCSDPGDPFTTIKTLDKAPRHSMHTSRGHSCQRKDKTDLLHTTFPLKMC